MLHIYSKLLSTYQRHIAKLQKKQGCLLSVCVWGLQEDRFFNIGPIKNTSFISRSLNRGLKPSSRYTTIDSNIESSRSHHGRLKPLSRYTTIDSNIEPFTLTSRAIEAIVTLHNH